MRLKQVSLAAAISVVAGLTTATVGLTGTAAWADSAAALPLSHYAHMLVDTAHQHLFFSQGAGSTGIVVTDLAGNPVTTLTGEQGATGLALSPDGGTLYAALADGDAVAAIDTATLTESARYATGTGSGPVSVAVAGGKLWYGYTADGRGGIGSVDPAAAVPVATPQPGMASWSAAPLLATGGGVLAAEEPQQSLSHVATFDVSSGTATVKANSDVYGGTATGFQVTGDGTEVLLAAPQQPALRAFRTSDLLSAKPAGYNTGGSNSAPGALALDTDGTIAVGGSLGADGQSYLYAGSTATEHHYVFPSRTLAPDGLEWAGDGTTLYAVAQDPSGAYLLHVLSDAKLTDIRVWLTAPQRAYPTHEFTITGSLTTDGFLPTGARLHVTRDGTELPDATVGADGTFSVSDTRPDAGAYTYAVSYAGDATHRPATLSLTVHVALLATGITGPDLSSARPSSVVFKGSLITESNLGSLPQGTTVQVSRTDEDTQQTVQLPSASVDPATTEFTVIDAPHSAGRFTYHLFYAGDATHNLTAADASVQVTPYTPALTLKPPATATRAAALTFGGTLGDAPYPTGETVTVSRKDAAHTTTPVTWKVPVGTDGRITVKDTPTTGGADSYTVSYPGDAAHQAATASATVQVSRAATAVSVTSNASTYTYGATATVTAHLGTTYNGRTVSVYATPVGGKKTLVRTAAVDSRGNLKATYKLTRNTTFTASFAGDYRYAPATATRTVHDQVNIAERLGGYYTSTKYGTVTYRVYHHTVKPQVSGTVSPARSGQCMRFQAQEYSHKDWHTLTTSGCFSMTADSAGVTHLSLTNAVGQKFRVRTEYVASAKDTTNVTTWGGWLYLTVRT
ncbi:YncE family protein [Streptomyces sp. NPDC058420]|uniref:YncE family protein n=1 Tax=Streptomyces sp. NPDC058420 TaxID=3346489 RepID=UPI00364A817D